MKKTGIFSALFVLFITLCMAESPTQVFDPASSETMAASGDEFPRRKPPTEFNKQWYDVIPRTEKGAYPNVPAEWQPLDNPRYEVPDVRPLEGLRICVDAGHGGQVWGSTHGYTGGTRGRNTGLTESEANLRTAFFLWDLLTQAGAEVTMTRTSPDRMAEPCEASPKSDEWNKNRQEELYSRVRIADQAGCDYFITIHHNAGSKSNYVSCYYYDTSQWNDEYNATAPYVKRYPDEELNRERYQMTNEIQNALSRRLNLRVIDPVNEWSKMYYGHGVPSHDIVVLRESKLVGVLVEVSFMTDPEEDLRLNDPGRAKQAAIGIFEGIQSHFRYRPIRRWSERFLAKPQ
jgi:N-acetylmuramoyl-L-alanine amidase